MHARARARAISTQNKYDSKTHSRIVRAGSRHPRAVGALRAIPTTQGELPRRSGIARAPQATPAPIPRAMQKTRWKPPGDVYMFTMAKHSYHESSPVPWWRLLFVVYRSMGRASERALGENAIRRARSFLHASARLDAILIQTVIYPVRARDYCIINFITVALRPLRPRGKTPRPNARVVTTATRFSPFHYSIRSCPTAVGRYKSSKVAKFVFGRAAWGSLGRGGRGQRRSGTDQPRTNARDCIAMRRTAHI